MIDPTYLLVALCLLCVVKANAGNIESGSGLQQTLDSLAKEIDLAGLTGITKEVSENGCKFRSFFSLKVAIDEEEIKTEPNKVNLLKQYRRKLYEKCKPEIETDLSEAVGKLSTSHRRLALDLATTVLNFGNLHDDSSVAKAVAEHLKHHNPALRMMKSRQLFAMSMKGDVWEIIAPVRSKLFYASLIYKFLDQEDIDELSDFEKTWSSVYPVLIRIDNIIGHKGESFIFNAL